MLIYKVLHYPHVLLKKKSTNVENFTEGLKDFIKNLIATGYAFEGGGIAAPQVGINKRIFVCDFSKIFTSNDPKFIHQENDFSLFNNEGKKIEPIFPLVFINPIIVKKENPITTNWEGCLSFPDVESFLIPRFHEIEVHAVNEKNEFFSVKTNHLYAAVNFQHEIDHLDGITMIDHWEKASYHMKDIINDIRAAEKDPKYCKSLKKMKLIDAQKINFDFL